MTGSFAEQLKRVVQKAEARTLAIHVGSAEMAFESIVHGSLVTGAPALPVAPGNAPNAGKLRDGVTLEFPDATSAEITTPVPYAPDVEDNLRGVHFHSGGPHGWKLTAAGYPRIVEQVARRVTGGET